MTRVPFGMTCNPFLLFAALQHHLKKYKEQYESYKDELSMGTESDNAAVKLYNNATKMFQAAKMKLHKWLSRSKMLRHRFQHDYWATMCLGYLSGVLKVLRL